MESNYAALTQGSGFAEVGRTLIAVTGPDRSSFLHSFTTNDIKGLKAGAGCEAFVTSPQGKTLGHVFVFCEPHRLILDTSPAQAKTLIAHFERYAITEEVEFADQSAQQRILLVCGPRSASALEQISGSRLPTEGLSHVSSAIAGRDVIVRRVPYAGCESFFLEMAASDVAAVSAALSSAGIAACGADSVECVRLETGFPLFGTDITDENLPQEVNRDKQAINFTKGCYLGQETVARIDALGHVNRLLRGLKFAGTQVPAAGQSLTFAGQTVGHVTSAAWSPRLNAPLALAYIRRQHAKTGTQLQADASAGEVVDLPVGR